MSLKDVFHYIKDMNEANDKEIKTLKHENIGLKDDKKAMAQIMEERAEQSAQTVRDLTEQIDFLTQRVSDLREDRLRLIKADEAQREEIKRQEMVIASLRGEIRSLNKDIERTNISKDRFSNHILSLNEELATLKDELCEYRENKYNKPQPQPQPEPQPLTPEKAWENFKQGIKAMQNRCLMAAMKYRECGGERGVPVYPSSKPVWQCWSAHHGDDNDWFGGEGKPSKDDILDHFQGLILMRLVFKHPEYESETELLVGFNEGEWEKTFTIHDHFDFSSNPKDDIVFDVFDFDS
tara:strand:- start:590 stop:1471 length:882 start_codon:yes stop_codon:yes gene_type:complete